MDSTGWKMVFSWWQKNLYTDIFVFVCLFIALITSIKYWRREKVFTLFFFYIISALLLLIFCDVIRFFLNLKSKEGTIFNETGNICFALYEYIVFYSLFHNILKSRTMKKVMTLFLMLYAAISVIFLIKEFDNTFLKTQIVHYSDMVVSVELLFLVVLSISYYYELLKRSSLIDLLKRPSFWIVSGLFFYCLLISSFFIISVTLSKEYEQIYSVFYAIHYISFGLLFLSITKAILCKKPLTI